MDEWIEEQSWSAACDEKPSLQLLFRANAFPTNQMFRWLT